MPHVYINPWNWRDNRNYGPAVWYPPGDEFPIGHIDRRSIVDKLSRPPTATGNSIWSYTNPQSGMALNLGSRMDANLSVVQKSGIETLLGFRPTEDTLQDVLKELLLNTGDIRGETSPKPFRGLRLGKPIKLYLGGYGAIVDELVAFNSKAYQNTIAIFQEDYRKYRAELASLPPARADAKFIEMRRRTGWMMGALRIRNSADLLPPEFASDGYLPEGTQYADNFPTNGNLDGSTAGDGADSTTWDEFQGTNATVASNQLLFSGNIGQEAARLDAGVSGEDQEGFISIAVWTYVGAALSGGVLIAQDSNAAENGYIFERVQNPIPQDVWRIQEMAAGSGSVHGESGSGGLSKMTGLFDGSNISMNVDDVLEMGPISESTHTGQTLGGVYGFSNGSSNSASFDGFDHRDAPSTGDPEAALIGGKLRARPLLLRGGNLVG